MRTTFLAAALLPLAAAFSPAQTPDHLVGVTRNAPLLRHLDHWTCAQLAQCPLGFPNAAALPPWAGGTGWDPIRSGAWVTNGQFLAKFDDNCNVQCPPVPFPGLGAVSVATGLEVVESQNQLWMIDSNGILHLYALACPPVPAGVCATPMVGGPVQQRTSGLAVDECGGFVFISYPDFGTGANWIVVSTVANPCVPLQRIPLQPCPGAVFGPITGLAVNGCSGILYATDGVNTVAINYVPAAPAIAITGTNCCLPPVVGPDPLIGLAVRPGRATSAGAVCANGVCPPCPMNHTLRNDPNLGNAQFSLGLDSAPAGSLAWCVIGAGPCSPPGVLVPPLCGPLFATPILGTIGPVLTGGVGGCTGTATFPLGLPVIPGLCGAVLSSQCVVFCQNTAGLIGTSVSNCLSWQLQCN
jgi:hypothetical protein